VPTIPGSPGVVEDEEKAVQIARGIGFPVLLKASAGGGGRGMRVVRSAGDLAQSFRAAQSEAMSAFGVADVYLEKYLDAPRHIEVQVMADEKGNVVHLGERECSIQRRHQKIVEEALSPAVTEKLRQRMGKTAVDAARSIGYASAGTVEFLLDPQGNFYFMEMNTRIQVEHGVTELVTGRDLVKEQIKVAAGETLSFAQKDLVFQGHALECRVNAEDPFTFVPSAGTIHHWHVPGGPGVRVDTFAHEGCVVSPHYDSLVAKVMTWGRDRPEAIARMRRCLEMTVVDGIKTNIPLHLRILDDPDFNAGRMDTRFMERFAVSKKAPS
jgi:acetyl-CoA carboxylase biotin carboxylase subunit